MTPQMAFECLLVSRNPVVIGTLNRTLRDLSISTRICLHSAKALNALADGGADLVVIDWEDEVSSQLLQGIWKKGLRQKPTVVAIAEQESWIPGAHIVLRKPVTAESTAKTLRDAYSRMLLDYRRHARCAIMIPVVATGATNRKVPVTITDIGCGGVGLRSRETVAVGDVLSMHVWLPGARREVYFQARVLWTRPFDRIGCEFLRIPPVDMNILHDWLGRRMQVKKPLVTI